MLTKIDLCSMALLKLGEAPIQSFADDAATAKLARTLYDSVINALLAMHPWRFATAQIELVKNTDGDFVIPSDVLRIFKSDGKIVGNKILSDKNKISVWAIVKTDSDNFPAYFVSMAATRLAMEFCIPLSGNQNIFRMLVALYETELQTAKFLDSTTDMSNNISNFSLIDSRF